MDDARHRRLARSAHQAGLTLIEVMIAVVLLTAILGSAVTLLDTSNELAQSVNHERAAASRVDRALAVISDEFRKGSLATVTHLDDSTFSDGDTGTGFHIRPVEGWNGSAILGDQVEYEFSLPVGETEGELVRREGGLETLLARGITSFSAERIGSSFEFTVTAESGPEDDRRRRSSGSLRVMARNP
jgi:prepilin-type N-terminal cleavage/methylation domain-containing protein